MCKKDYEKCVRIKSDCVAIRRNLTHPHKLKTMTQAILAGNNWQKRLKRRHK